MSLALVSRKAALLPPWLRNELWARARAVPSLDLRFADNKSLVDATTGAQLVTFTRASSGTYVGSDGLIKTATTNEPRFDHNPTTGESLGLLVEEQRSNLLLNSGTLSTQSVTVTAVAHTLSFTGTGTVTLSGASTAGPLVGTGTGEANRVSLTFTPTAGTLTLTVSGTVTDAQLEAGSFPTSYIPTTTATVTRAADVASISGSNFSSWYRQNDGTVLADVARSQNGGRIFMFDDGIPNDRWEIRHSTTYNLNSWKNGVTDVSVSAGNFGDPALNIRVAGANKSNEAAIAANGGAVATDTSSQMPSGQTTMRIGSYLGTATFLNGTIRRLTYWPTRLPNSTLQAITQ